MNHMINDKNKHSWCVNAYHAMSGMNNGTTKICCMHRPLEHNMTLGNDSIESIMHKKEFKRIRKALSKGVRHEGCRLCWEEEDAGRQSKRLRDNERYEWEIKTGQIEPYNGLAKVELNLGNTCNLACRTCKASISSGWYKEEYNVYKKQDGVSFKDFSDNLKKYNMTYADDSPFWQDIESHLPTIKQFDFYGGEPFMIKKQWKLLEKAVALGYAKDIELHYNTNGTHWPKEVKLWKNFRSVNLSFSIDGTEDQFEYMRYPAKWDLVKQNMQKAIELNNENGNMSISWCVTISNTNIFDLHNVIDHWYKNYSHIGLYLNLVHNPRYFNISIMPEYAKQIAIKNLETNVPQNNKKAWHYLTGIINFIKQGTPDDKEWNEFITKLEIHDKYRKQDAKSTWPNLKKVLEHK